MLWKATGILGILWLIGIIVSFTVSGTIKIVFVIASMSLLVTALVLIQIGKRQKKSSRPDENR